MPLLVLSWRHVVYALPVVKALLAHLQFVVESYNSQWLSPHLALVP